MVNFICTKCKYRFGSTRNPDACPYCNDSTLEKEKSASELLDEVTGILEE